FVHGLLPQRDRELDRLDRFLAVQHDGLSVGLDLLAAPRPEIGIPPARRVAERVPGGLADRPPLGFQLLAGFAESVPGLGEGRVPGFLEPGFAIGDEPAAYRPRHADPLAVDRADQPG